MTLDDYIGHAKQCAQDYAAGDSTGLELLARIAFEADEAKHKLRISGYGWTGLSLLKTVEEVLEYGGLH